MPMIDMEMDSDWPRDSIVLGDWVPDENGASWQVMERMIGRFDVGLHQHYGGDKSKDGYMRFGIPHIDKVTCLQKAMHHWAAVVEKRESDPPEDHEAAAVANLLMLMQWQELEKNPEVYAILLKQKREAEAKPQEAKT